MSDHDDGNKRDEERPGAPGDGTTVGTDKPPLFPLGMLRRRRKQAESVAPSATEISTAPPATTVPATDDPTSFPLSDLHHQRKTIPGKGGQPPGWTAPKSGTTETPDTPTPPDADEPALFPQAEASNNPFVDTDEPTLFPEAAAAPRPSRTPLESQVFRVPRSLENAATPDPSSIMVFNPPAPPKKPPPVPAAPPVGEPSVEAIPTASPPPAKEESESTEPPAARDAVLIEMPGTALQVHEQQAPRLVEDKMGLSANGIGKRFKQRQVLRGVSLSVQRGEVVGLLGPNGAGKTTCFYIITGLISADYGSIKLDNQDITTLPMYRRSRLGIGYLPQEPSIFRGMTVEQNIRAVLEAVEAEPDAREAMLDDLMAEFSITHLRRTPALALSGGERRRLEIARALASQPHFILLDEPLAGIDPIALSDIRNLVTHLKDRGIGVLITDHNVRETLDIVDRAYIIHNGEVLMSGKPSDIVRHDDVRRVYLGDGFRL